MATINGVNMALGYFQRGWKLVELCGVNDHGTATCWKGKDCSSPGKHPVETAWQLHYAKDEDTILGWFDRPNPANVGLLLGPLSGVIDVELDDDAAKSAWASLGLGEIWTPTYSAGRGPHRLFRWDEGLPATAVKKVMGIEVRIGNGGAAAQSVLPPSMHHTGVRYQWIDGLSPDDVELQPLPEALVNLLWNDDGGRALFTGKPSKPARTIIHQGAGEGGRNESLHRFAVSMGFKASDIDNPLEQQDLLAIIQAVNLTKCKPPLGDDEVASVFRSAVGYVRKSRAQGMDTQAAIEQSDEALKESKKKPRKKPAGSNKKWVNVFTDTGLSFAPLDPGSDASPEWGPGEWQLTVVHSDPLEYRLHVPAWKKYTANGLGNITLTVDQFRSAARMAAQVLAATGVIMLDDLPGKWKKIWDGGYKVADPRAGKTKRRIARGVKAKLLDNVEHEWPGASSLRYVTLAGWLYDRLSQAAQPTDDDLPDPNGRAAWRADGTLWFAWNKVWEDVERQHRVLEGERLSLKRRLLGQLEAKDFVHREYRHLSGLRKTYVVWTRQEFAALERMASEAEQEAQQADGGTPPEPPPA
jgi:hypothetical protein